MAKTQTKQTEKKEEKVLYEVQEILTSNQGHFSTGLVHKKDKDGKDLGIKYLKKVTDENGKLDKVKTKVFVNAYIAGDQEKNERSNFKEYALSLDKASKFKEAGVDFNSKVNVPFRVRFVIQQYYDKEHRLNVLRELINIAVKNGDTWEWVIQSQPKAEEEPKEVEVDEDDLPF